MDYRLLALSTTAEIREAIEKRFKSLIYKDENVTVGLAATPAEIALLEETTKTVWPDINLIKCTKADALSNETFQKFFSTHVHATQYAISIKKCNDASCEFHMPIKMPLEEFAQVEFHCTPQLKPNTTEYESFESSYGRHFSDEHCPSLQKRNKKTSTNEATPKPPFQLQKSQVRLFFKCCNCNFPRLFYTKKKLTKEE